MNSLDQEMLIGAIEDARLVLGEYLEPGPRDATRTIERLLAISRSERRPSCAGSNEAAQGAKIGRDRATSGKPMICSACGDCGSSQRRYCILPTARKGPVV